MIGDAESQFGMVRSAARGGGSVAWVGWVFGLLLLGLGLVPPRHWFLLVVGALMVSGLSVHAVLRVRERVRHQRSRTSRADAR